MCAFMDGEAFNSMTGLGSEEDQILLQCWEEGVTIRV